MSFCIPLSHVRKRCSPSFAGPRHTEKCKRVLTRKKKKKKSTYIHTNERQAGTMGLFTSTTVGNLLFDVSSRIISYRILSSLRVTPASMRMQKAASAEYYYVGTYWSVGYPLGNASVVCIYSNTATPGLNIQTSRTRTVVRGSPRVGYRGYHYICMCIITSAVLTEQHG